MKKLIMIFTAFVLSFALIQGVQAKTVHVTALEDFSASNPPAVLHVQMNANTRLDYDTMLFQGFQVTGKIRQRSGGGFVFIPVDYINYHEERLPVTQEYPAVIKTRGDIVRQNQPFTLVFPNASHDTFQYYVPSSSDVN